MSQTFVKGGSENDEAPPIGVEKMEALPAFPDLFRAQAPFVCRCLRRLGLSAADADDVCQEVFLVVHRKLGGFEGPSVRAWIYGICIRKASDFRKLAYKKRERASAEMPESESPADGADVSLEGRRALARLDRVLTELDEDKRAAFILYEIEGLSLQEVAAACECPLQTVYSRLASARRKIEQALTEGREELQ